MTHRFHPLFEREFRFVDRRHTWEEDRVALLGDDGRGLLAACGVDPDVDPVDAFVIAGGGALPVHPRELAGAGRDDRRDPRWRKPGMISLTVTGFAPRVS